MQPPVNKVRRVNPGRKPVNLKNAVLSADADLTANQIKGLLLFHGCGSLRQLARKLGYKSHASLSLALNKIRTDPQSRRIREKLVKLAKGARR